MLSDIRKKRNMSQSQLASCSGVSLRSIQMYEQGHRDIDRAELSTLLDLCCALDCKLVDILNDDRLKRRINSNLV